MADTDTQILRPISFTVPQLSGAGVTAEKGLLFMSGAKLWVVTAVGTHEIITSS